MADLDNLEYYIKFPNPNFNYNQNGDHDFVFVVNEDKIPVILLFGWAGCQDKYLAKYSQIYEEKGLITLRYTAPIKCMFLRRYQMTSIGEKLVKLLFDLNFDTHPIIVHCFSNGGAFLYQNFSLAMEKNPKPLQIKGVIFDSAPGRRRVLSLFRAISAILGGNIFYNFSVSLIMTMFLSMIWLYEVISNTIYPRPSYQSNPLENLKNEKGRWPQCFIYSKNDDLIPFQDIEYFAGYRKNLGIDITTVCYEKSLHVKHLAENRDSYVKTVYNFINKCLNGNLLKKSSPSRIINVSSSAAKFSKLSVKSFTEYKGFATYSDTKLCNIFFTQELAKILKDRNVSIFSVHPGAVQTEILQLDSFNPFLQPFIKLTMKLFYITPEEGAQTSIYCACEQGIEDCTGCHFEYCQVVEAYKSAQNPALAKEIWDETFKVIKYNKTE